MAESSVQADDAVREQPIPSSFEQLPFPSTFSFAPPNRHDDDGGMATRFVGLSLAARPVSYTHLTLPTKA